MLERVLSSTPKLTHYCPSGPAVGSGYDVANQAFVDELDIKGRTYREREGGDGGDVHRRKRLNEDLKQNKVKSKVAIRRVGTYVFARVEADSALADRREGRRLAVVNPFHIACLATRARRGLNRVGDLGTGLGKIENGEAGTHVDGSVDAGGEEEGEGGEGRESVHRGRW